MPPAGFEAANLARARPPGSARRPWLFKDASLLAHITLYSQSCGESDWLWKQTTVTLKCYLSEYSTGFRLKCNHASFDVCLQHKHTTWLIHVNKAQSSFKGATTYQKKKHTSGKLIYPTQRPSSEYGQSSMNIWSLNFTDNIAKQRGFFWGGGTNVK